MGRLRASDRLLLRLPNWLGDFVMAEPTVAALAGALRTGRLARLGLVAPERFYQLFEGRFEGVERLRAGESWEGFDTALFLDGSLRSVWRTWRVGLKRRFGWTHGVRGLALSGGFRPALEGGRVPLGLGPKGRGARRLARPFGAACNELVGALGVAVEDRAPRLASSAVARVAVAARLKALGLAPQAAYLVLDASARPGSAKAAPAELWAAALRAAELSSLPSVVLLSAPGEASLARALKAQLDHPRVHLYDEPPPGLGELLAVIEGAQVFLGTDSGPRHLARAAGCPQVILFGPTDPRHTADHNRNAQLLRVELDCSPCHRETCPLTGASHGRCMSEISPARIATLLRRALE